MSNNKDDLSFRDILSGLGNLIQGALNCGCLLVILALVGLTILKLFFSWIGWLGT